MHISKKSIVSFLLCLSFVIAVIPFTAVETKATDLIITLDPGHGGHDPGATGAKQWGGDNEKAYNLTQGLAAKARLEEYGVTVHMTRDDDTFVVLEERPRAASQDGSDAFISIHNNSYTSSSARGCVVFTANPYGRNIYQKSLDIANSIMNRLMNDVGIPKNTNPYYVNDTSMTYQGTYGDYNCGSGYVDKYKVIRWSKIYGGINAAMIVESCFQSNYNDVQSFLLNPAKVIQTGQAIADGIADYYGLDLIKCHNNLDVSSSEAVSGGGQLKVNKTFTKGVDASFPISGWSVHNEGVSKYEYRIDSGAWQSMNSYFREDVKNAMPDYPNCTDINAFTHTFDVSALPTGEYPIEIRGCTKSGNYYDIAVFNMIVNPAAGTTYMRTDKARYALNEPIKITAKGDATGAWVGLFGQNETPGEVSSYYWFEMHSSEVTVNDLINEGKKNDRPAITAGTYKLITFIDEGYVVDPNVPVKTVVLVNNIEKNIDSPASGSTVTQGQTIDLQGWALHPDSIASFKLYMDGGNELTLGSMRRDDVLNAYPAYATACESLHGYKQMVYTNSIPVGTHNFTVVATTGLGDTFIAAEFTIKIVAPIEGSSITSNSPDIEIDKSSSVPVVLGVTDMLDAESVQALFDGDCRITKADGSAVDGFVGSGCIIKLYIDGTVYDAAVIIVDADLDGNGISNGKDLIRAKKFMADSSVECYDRAADLDGDGVVTDADLALIAESCIH